MFHASNFARLPVKLLSDMFQYNSEAMQSRTNAASVTTAKLAMVVCSALGSKGSKLKIDGFLPFEISNNDNKLKPSTKQVLQWALKNEKMPPAIVGMIGAEMH